MALKMIFFDLDGTLLPMDQDAFIHHYFRSLSAHLAPHGYEPHSLMQGVQAGIGAMIANTGEKRNEEVFWDTFCAFLGRDARRDIPLFEDYYHRYFIAAKAACGCNPKAAECIAWLKKKGFRLALALATNPFFPALATLQRIQWAGLNPDDFEIITTYENSRHCKPNPEYYRDLIRELDVDPRECLMAGNDALEDLVAETTGMKVFLLTEWLLNKPGIDITPYPQGDFDDLIRYISSIE